MAHGALAMSLSGARPGQAHLPTGTGCVPRAAGGLESPLHCTYWYLIGLPGLSCPAAWERE